MLLLGTAKVKFDSPDLLEPLIARLMDANVLGRFKVWAAPGTAAGIRVDDDYVGGGTSQEVQGGVLRGEGCDAEGTTPAPHTVLHM